MTIKETGASIITGFIQGIIAGLLAAIFILVFWPIISGFASQMTWGIDIILQGKLLVLFQMFGVLWLLTSIAILTAKVAIR